MYERVLIVRLSSLGDTALTLPLLFALTRMMPEAHTGWVVDEPFAPLLKHVPQLNRIHVWKKTSGTLSGLRRLLPEIRAERYEISVDPQGLTRSAMIPFLAGIPLRVGFQPAPLEGRELAPFLTNCRLSPPPDRKHVSARNLYLGTGLGLDMPKRFPFCFPNDMMSDMKIRHWWRENTLSGRALIFGIGAGWPTKVWAVTEMALLVDRAREMGFKVVVLWGPAEKRRLDGWRSLLADRVCWAPETDIQEMISLLRLCNGYAGPDSAPLHLAWLLGKPTFSWFGASDPTRCAPRGENHAFIARGPHNWNRKRPPRSGGLSRLTGKEALPAFEKWLFELQGDIKPCPISPIDTHIAV
jgi:heptosyltransferase-1